MKKETERTQFLCKTYKSAGGGGVQVYIKEDTCRLIGIKPGDTLRLTAEVWKHGTKKKEK